MTRFAATSTTTAAALAVRGCQGRHFVVTYDPQSRVTTARSTDDGSVVVIGPSFLCGRLVYGKLVLTAVFEVEP